MNNLSRRGLFGASLGAALAGPSAVKSVMDGDMFTPDYDSPALDILNHGIQPSDGDWLKRQLQEVISEKNSLTARPPVTRTFRPEQFRIDGLRSVSPSNRARMMAEASTKHEYENQMSYFDRRIAELKERLGLLGALL